MKRLFKAFGVGQSSRTYTPTTYTTSPAAGTPPPSHPAVGESGLHSGRQHRQAIPSAVDQEMKQLSKAAP
ncbi:hypothetical protein C2I33_22200 [Ralstonia solanacearum]|nr:hypothetical protein C2I33_22200 [Ralstonia solanacearum]